MSNLDKSSSSILFININIFKINSYKYKIISIDISSFKSIYISYVFLLNSSFTIDLTTTISSTILVKISNKKKIQYLIDSKVKYYIIDISYVTIIDLFIITI